jgi:hypothetical protein
VKHVGRRIARLLVVPSLVATGLVLAAGPAQADFHLMKIREVQPDGPGGEDFVELQMYSPGQTQLNGHMLTVYGNGGIAYPLTLSGNVSNGENQRTILIASSATVGGIPADYTGMSPAMSDSAGAVCFGTVDCMEWGTGVDSVAVGTPATAPTSGESIKRTIIPNCPTLLENADDTNDSATDFKLATPSPRPNSVAPTETPCAPGTVGGAPILKGLKARVRGNAAVISGEIQPPAPGDRVSLTFFANGSPLRKVAKKNAVLNADSKFKKRFRIPSASTRCRVKVAFHGAQLGKKTFRC